MAYDENLAQRLRSLIGRIPEMREKKMFGGVGYLLNGNMCVGIHKDFLVLRVGVEQAEIFLRQKHVKPMDITGKPMKGWVMLAPPGFKSEADLKRFVNEAIDFVETLPSK